MRICRLCIFSDQRNLTNRSGIIRETAVTGGAAIIRGLIGQCRIAGPSLREGAGRNQTTELTAGHVEFSDNNLLRILGRDNTQVGQVTLESRIACRGCCGAAPYLSIRASRKIESLPVQDGVPLMDVITSLARRKER